MTESNKIPVEYRFSFGPWNISEGADPFGPDTRKPLSFAKILPLYKSLGIEAVQFHDDDVVPGMEDMTPGQIIENAKEVKKQIDDHGLIAEFVAPRMWFSPDTIDGGYTSNSATERRRALDRSYRTIDIMNAMGTDLMVLWLAREGTYIREAKNARVAVDQITEAINKMLEYDPKIRIAIEPKPNEPMDHTYIPTIGHALALAHRCVDPSRVGGLIESAHAILAGLDPSDEMAYALAHGKLWGVHLNDQNGLKFDEDKAFGAVDLRRAFNQVRVLEEGGYGRNGEFIGLDVKAMRTTRGTPAIKHLANSREFFLRLVDKVRSLDRTLEQAFIAERDYEGLESYIVNHLLGAS
jgi:xylose isomerase